jgi:hypothetical protein
VTLNTWSAVVDRLEIDEDYGITMTDKQWETLVYNLNKAAYYAIDEIISEFAGEYANE